MDIDETVREISVSEAIGEIRKIARTYEALKRAEDIVQILIEHEARLRKLKAEIKEAEDILSQIHANSEDIIEKHKKEVENLDKQKKAIAEQIQNSRKEADEYMEKTRAEAALLMDKAKAKVAETERDILALQEKKRVAEEDALKAEEKLSILREQINEKKNQILSLFGAE